MNLDLSGDTALTHLAPEAGRNRSASRHTAGSVRRIPRQKNAGTAITPRVRKEYTKSFQLSAIAYSPGSIRINARV